jgi:ElaB/YqjD/DUF883 family membrane-anchored ribosome-binding protein
MERTINAVDDTEEKTSNHGCSCKPVSFEKVKNSIADTLHTAADTLDKKVADKDSRCGLAQLGKQASERLDRSADYIREFDYKPADAKVREFVRERPGSCLLFAGAIGLIIGAFVRRR